MFGSAGWISSLASAPQQFAIKKFGCRAVSFNPTFPEKTANHNGWVSPWKFGLNQGPVVIMIENYTTELIWNIMKQCPYVIKGLQLAGFSDGWLEEQQQDKSSQVD